MPPAVPLIAAAAGAEISGLVAGDLAVDAFASFYLGGIGSASLIGSIAGFVVSTGLNAIGSRIFAPSKPKADFTSAAQSQAIMVRSSVETHKIVYGQMKIAGPLVYVGTTDNGPDANGNNVNGTNVFVHLIVALTGHEVEEIGDIYFNDQPVTINEAGYVTSYPYTKATIPTVTQNISTAVRTNEVVTVTTTVDHGFSAGDKVTIASVTPDGAMNGAFIIQSIPSSNTFTYNNGGPNSSAAGGTATDQTILATSTSWARVKKFLGAADQAASPDLVAEVPGWDASHTLSGISYVYVRLQFDQSIFSSGIPNISAVIKGKKVFDPRDSSTAWSDNVALCTRDYLTNDYGFNCQTDEINDDYFSAAANHCDESIALTTGGTQNRYTCNGVIDTANAPIDNLNALVAAMAGTVTYVQGQFRAYAGVFDATVGDLDTTMLAGSVKVHTRTTRQQLFNSVQGTYTDPNLNWQPTDFSPILNTTYQAQDGGQAIYKDIQLPFTNHPEAAQRIAKVLLEQGRQGIQVELVLNHKGIPFAVWDTVTYTDANLGWDHKVFRIKKLTSAGTGPITLSLQEESSASYDWNSGEATIKDPAPDTNLPDPLSVLSPAGLSVQESIYVTRDGAGVKAMATLSWLPSPDVFVTQYQAEYQLSTDSAWTILPRTADTTIDILDIAPGDYNFRVKALNGLGVGSGYVAVMQQIAGLLAPPTEPQNLTISTIGGLAILRWDQSPDLDVKIGGYYEFRHSPTTTDGWSSSTSIGNTVPGSHTSVTLPLKPGVYLAKAVDSSDIESTNAASITTTQATALAFANVTSLTEDPTFSGTKTDCFVSSSKLTLSDAGIFDDITDLDSVTDLDLFGGVVSSGTYAFDGGIDLGSVMSVRLTSHLQAAIVNVFDMIDDRAVNIDDWTDFDGVLTADADAVVYVRTTQTDPAGSPTWSAWNRLDSGEFSARGFQFECELDSSDPAYNIQISQLSVTVDQVT